MATNILNQVYKEAKVTSKGVIQMNRTLNKIYEDQEKGNKRQDKFLTDLRNRQRREEREEKKRQSDLKKLIAGSGGALGAKKDSKDGGVDLGDGKGILGAITGGLGLAFNLLKTLLIAGLLKRLTNFFRLPRFGGGRGGFGGGNRGGGNRGGNRGGNGANNGGGGNRGGGGNQGGNRGNPASGGPITRGNNSGGTGSPKPPSNGISPGPKNINRPTIPKAQPWWKRAGSWLGRGTKGIFGGIKGLLGRALGPALLIWSMWGESKRLYEAKEYRNLARYILTSVLTYGAGTLAATAATAVAGLLGVATGGLAGVPAMLLAFGAGAATAATVEPIIDDWLASTGLVDESTGDAPAPIDMKGSVDIADLEATAANPNDFKTKLEAANAQGNYQTLAKGGGIFDVPGHGQGDQVPMMLPPGAFVLNRVAAKQMFARGGMPGMIPTLLEPGEKVFMPGDPLMDMAMSFNSTFSRFQKGGMVDQPTTDSSSEKITDRGLNQLAGKGGSQAVISVGQMLLDEGFTVKEHPNFEGRSFNKEGTARVGGHSQNSLHYKNLAIDVTDWREGAWQQRTATLAEKMYRQRKELNLTQIIHDPWGAWFAGEGQKGPGIGGHETHLHLGFATGPASDKGYVGAGNENTPGNNSTGGMFGAVGSAVSNIFSPITEAIGGALGEDGPMGKLFSQIGEVSKEMFGELNSPEVKAMINDISQGVSQQISGMSLSAQPSDQHMKTIREAQDPEAGGEQTIVQVVPQPNPGQEPTISGVSNDNVPVGLSTRCSSWASADYRYDRSLNTETL